MNVWPAVTLVMLDLLVLIVTPMLLAFGAMSDFLTYKIPNWISLALIGVFAGAVLLSGMAFSLAGFHVLTGALALTLGFALFAFNLIGGGDAKFFAAGALWMGPAGFLDYMFAFALAGGVLAAAVLALRRLPQPAFTARIGFLNALWTPKGGIPYGVALGLGALIALPHTPLFIAAVTP